MAGRFSPDGLKRTFSVFLLLVATYILFNNVILGGMV
jgi:hypothetical protein